MYQVVCIKYIIIFALLGILSTYMMPQTTAYAEGISLKIKPASLQIHATSPADVKAPFTIENPGLDPLVLQISFKRFRDSGESLGKIIYNEQTAIKQEPFLQNISVLDNKIPITSLTLAPKQQKKLILSIPILKDEAKQDHYFSIIFSTKQQDQARNTEDDTEETEKTQATTGIEAGIALPILLSIGQDDKKTGFLKTFSAPVFNQKGPVPFTIEAQNTGDHFITAQGVILIKNMFGQTVGRIDIPKTTVLAETGRFLTTDNHKQQDNKHPKVFWDESVLFGVYTATLTLAFSPEQSLYTEKISFVSFPIISLVITFTAIIIAVIFIIRVKRKISQE